MKPVTVTAQHSALGEAAGVDLVFFSAGGLILAVESIKVRDLCEVAGSQAPSMAALLHLPNGPDRAAPPRERLLRLVHPDGTLTVRVDEPVTQGRLPATALYPLPPLLKARLTLPGVCALARWRNADGEGLAVVLNPAGFHITF